MLLFGFSGSCHDNPAGPHCPTITAVAPHCAAKAAFCLWLYSRSGCTRTLRGDVLDEQSWELRNYWEQQHSSGASSTASESEEFLNVGNISCHWHVSFAKTNLSIIFSQDPTHLPHIYENQDNS
jgi:hypothetical protein